jgi:hypothetical protein
MLEAYFGNLRDSKLDLEIIEQIAQPPAVRTRKVLHFAVNLKVSAYCFRYLVSAIADWRCGAGCNKGGSRTGKKTKHSVNEPHD